MDLMELQGRREKAVHLVFLAWTDGLAKKVLLVISATLDALAPKAALVHLVNLVLAKVKPVLEVFKALTVFPAQKENQVRSKKMRKLSFNGFN